MDIKEERYIGAGDRVIVTEGIKEKAHARRPRPELVGMKGIVMENDGWGLCKVELDDGTWASLWNAKDLKRVE